MAEDTPTTPPPPPPPPGLLPNGKMPNPNPAFQMQPGPRASGRRTFIAAVDAAVHENMFAVRDHLNSMAKERTSEFIKEYVLPLIPNTMLSDIGGEEDAQAKAKAIVDFVKAATQATGVPPQVNVNVNVDANAPATAPAPETTKGG